MVTSSSVIWSYSTNLTEIDVDDHRDNIEDMYIYICIIIYPIMMILVHKTLDFGDHVPQKLGIGTNTNREMIPE